jgi:pre-mRNA-splicing helicase BRR2
LVPTRKQAQLTAINLFTFTAAEGQPNIFFCTEEEDIKPFLDLMMDKTMKVILSQGVVYIHVGLTPSNHPLVEQFFSSRAVQVAVVT